MSKTPFNVSQYDLNHVLKPTGKQIENLSLEELEEILLFVGMDKKGVEVEEVLHRPKFSANNEPWLGKRFTGFERQDKEWLYGGKCSLDNIIHSQTDLDHKRDLVMMSRQSNNTAEMIEMAEEARKNKQ